MQPAGAAAANALGLSTQVSAQLVYWTDGTSRSVNVDGRTIRFRHGTPRRMLGAGSVAGLVLQALQFLGKDQITDGVIADLSDLLTERDKQTVRKLSPSAPAWMRSFLVRVGSAQT